MGCKDRLRPSLSAAIPRLDDTDVTPKYQSYDVAFFWLHASSISGLLNLGRHTGCLRGRACGGAGELLGLVRPALMQALGVLAGR